MATTWGTAVLLVVLNLFSVTAFSDVVIDTASKATGSAGDWQVSNNSTALWASKGATFTWFFDPRPAGLYEVYMKWPGSPRPAKAVNVDVNAFDGSHRVKVDQSVNPDNWNLIGTWYFEMDGSVTVTAASGSDVITFADAVWFKLVQKDEIPVAVIDSITPKSVVSGSVVKLFGHGSDKLGSITSHRWSSNIDGILSETDSFTTTKLSAGTHTISYSVKNEADNWSQPVTQELVVAAAAGQEIIIDNNNTANTARSGTWSLSSGSGAYGADSLWARNGATFTWYFTPTQSGTSEVFMWWTQYASRTTSAAVDITHASGTSRVYVNQQTNGSQWNSLGQYSFNANTRYSVRITAASGSTISTCADAVRALFSSEPNNPEPPDSGTENIYVGQIYSWNTSFSSSIKSMLTKLGATNQTSYWRYTARNKTYYIRFVSTPADLLAALKEKNSHIVTGGHSNFGMGPTFYSGGQKQTNFYYVDDDHLLPVGSETLGLNIDGMMYGQAYPNFKAIYKDGSSALTPYTFDQGTPAYNYYITYQVPGDSRWYRVELANGSYIQRYGDSDATAWYSSTGAKPDPVRNPQYFIVNNDTYYSRCGLVGNWSWSGVTGLHDDDGDDIGYMGYCYYSHSAGSGSNKVNWTLGINDAGRYRVFASWFNSSSNATNAKFTINHAAGATTVTVNQQRTATDFWNELGTFNFNRGESIVTLTDSANGRVIADAIWLRPADSSASGPVYCDNAFRYKFHYYTSSSRPNGKVIVKLKNRPNPADMQFARMFWGTCNVDTYFLDTFHRGIIFFTTGNINNYTGVKYLELYLKGYSDSQILTEVNKIEAVHQYYNFNLLPPSMR